MKQLACAVALFVAPILVSFSANALAKTNTPSPTNTPTPANTPFDCGASCNGERILGIEGDSAIHIRSESTTCVGDCHGSGTVTVDEILSMVNIATGTADLSTCAAGDADGSGSITVDEIIRAVHNALGGCTGG